MNTKTTPKFLPKFEVGDTVFIPRYNKGIIVEVEESRDGFLYHVDLESDFMCGVICVAEHELRVTPLVQDTKSATSKW